MSKHSDEHEDIEIQALIEKVYRQYGFDFRNYAMAALKRRIGNAMRAENLSSISALQERVLRHPDSLNRLLSDLSTNTTAMFRDPSFYIAFRQKVIPRLRTYPFIRIWQVGCSTGESVYSLAILLVEENLYDRCRIYATDMSETTVHQAKAGVFALQPMQQYNQYYLHARGSGVLSDYYSVVGDTAIVDAALKRNIVFWTHNLTTDGSFNEFNVILCRNVLIYFNQQLQNQVHTLLYQSLGLFGVLCLGKQESIVNTPHRLDYEPIDNQEKLYRKMSR